MQRLAVPQGDLLQEQGQVRLQVNAEGLGRAVGKRALPSDQLKGRSAAIQAGQQVGDTWGLSCVRHRNQLLERGWASFPLIVSLHSRRHMNVGEGGLNTYVL